MDRPAGAERSDLLRHHLSQDAVAVARHPFGEFRALLAATPPSGLEGVGSFGTNVPMGQRLPDVKQQLRRTDRVPQGGAPAGPEAGAGAAAGTGAGAGALLTTCQSAAPDVGGRRTMWYGGLNTS